MKSIVGIIGAVLMTGSALAQLPSSGVSPSGVLDGVYVQEHIPTKKVIAYPSLREADVMWSKRIWRKLDLRQKINFPLLYPEEPLTDRRSLWHVIRYGVETEGSLTPYEVVPSGESSGTGPVKFDFDGQFLYPIKPPNGNIKDSAYKNAIDNLFYTVTTIEKWDEELDQPAVDENGDPIYITEKNPISSTDISSYLIKEDWFFDKQRSVMDVRIIGICPEVKTYDENGNFKGLKQAFWLYFPECRYVFQNYFVYNRQNDAQRMSFDDLFWKRMFDSYIYKESNVYDREIQMYEKNGVRALLNSEKIKDEMSKIEHDLWHL